MENRWMDYVYNEDGTIKEIFLFEGKHEQQ